MLTLRQDKQIAIFLLALEPLFLDRLGARRHDGHAIVLIPGVTRENKAQQPDWPPIEQVGMTENDEFAPLAGEIGRAVVGGDVMDIKGDPY